MRIPVKLRVGNLKLPGELEYTHNSEARYGKTGDRIFFRGFPFSKKLNAEIKSMQGHHWHGFDECPRKVWSIADTPRNEFQLAWMRGDNPYEPYEQDIPEIETERPCFAHQKMLIAHGLTYRHVIWAAEMGTGKSLAMIEVLERSGVRSGEAWYVGPKAGVKAVRRELAKWDSKIVPVFMDTYEMFVKHMANWTDDMPAPRFVCFDESSKLKTPTSQRSQAALKLCDAMRQEHGRDCYIILMSGTPAPKSPLDWYHQCEIACPGFLKEGTINKFKVRLCLVEQRQSITGGVYPHIVTWLDDASKCAQCGKVKEEHSWEDDHVWKQSKNEVEFLYRRMQGLVVVQFKKDCLDLPEKRYEVIKVKPTVEILRAAKLIQAKSERAITALVLMREISDGFQYIEVEAGMVTCQNCHGRKEVEVFVPKENIDTTAPNTDINPDDFEREVRPCDNCGGKGEVKRYERDVAVTTSPKDEYFLDELDAHEDVGRYIVWGGFTGTLDRLVHLCHKHGWSTLRIDGRGYIGQDPHGNKLDDEELLSAMDRSHPRYKELLETHPRLCVVGHPQAGGWGLTLTASPVELFYSNVFNGEARFQAEDRAHRPGMDENRGLVIKDFEMLPVDKLVLENLKKKKKLQNLTMGQLKDAFVKDAIRDTETAVS